MLFSGYEIVSEESITLAETQRAGWCYPGPLCRLLMWSYSFSLFLHTMGVETIKKILNAGWFSHFWLYLVMLYSFHVKRIYYSYLYIIHKVSFLIHNHCCYHFCLRQFAFFNLSFAPSYCYVRHGANICHFLCREPAFQRCCGATFYPAT